MTKDSPEYLDKCKISRAFDRAAFTYEQQATVQHNVGEQLIKRLQWLKINPFHILDVGCGTGRLGRALSKRYKKANIYAVDISEQMLKQARKQTSRWFSKQQVIRADAVQLPFADRSIDLLLSNLMLQWCNPLDEVFTELVRVLKPKGMILFSTLGPDTLKELRHSWAQVDDAIHVNHFVDMHEIGDTLLRVGFSDPVMDVDWLTINYHDVFTLMSALKNVGAHNVTIGRSRNLTGKGKLKAMIAAYEHYRSPEGFLPATYEVIYGYALGKKENVSRSQSIDTAKIPISEIRQKYK